MVAEPVDEEGGRARDAREVGAVDVFGDAGGAGVAGEVGAEALDIEPELLGIGDQILGTERPAVREQKVVHRPEGALFGGRLRGLGRQLRPGMDVVQGQVPPDIAKLAEAGQELANDRLRSSAVGTFEVAVLDQGDRRLGGAADVVALGIDRGGEVDDRFCTAGDGVDARPVGKKRGGAKDDDRGAGRAEGGAEYAELRLL